MLIVFRPAALLTLAFLLASPLRAQDAPPGDAPLVNVPHTDPDSREDWRERVQASRRAYDDFAVQARASAAERAAARAARAPESHGAIEDFLADDTLQRGDVVVTDKGFRLFTGPSGAPGRPGFAPLPESMTRLRALEQAGSPAGR